MSRSPVEDYGAECSMSDAAWVFPGAHVRAQMALRAALDRVGVPLSPPRFEEECRYDTERCCWVKTISAYATRIDIAL